LEFAQCRAGFARKAALSKILSGKIPEGRFTVKAPTRIAKSAIRMAHPHSHENPGWFLQRLLADAEFTNDGLIALGIVSLEVIEQATPLADQHKQAAARAVVLLVHFEVVCQLANAFTDDGDLNLGAPRVSRVRLILVNDRFLLLSG
jgi:hypothetical protein